MRRYQKPRTRAEFVDQLRFEAMRLSPEVAVKIISEVEDHLDANIQARMNSGKAKFWPRRTQSMMCEAQKRF